MTDIVARLRSGAIEDEPFSLAQEAADEIERLRSDNIRLSDGIRINADLHADLDRCHRAIADLQAEVRRKSEEIELLRKGLEFEKRLNHAAEPPL